MITWWKGDKRLNTVATTSSSNNSVNIDVDNRIEVIEKSGSETMKLYGITPGSKVSTLKIRNLVMSDQGEYSCTASNKSGHFSTKFNVTITGKTLVICKIIYKQFEVKLSLKS